MIVREPPNLIQLLFAMRGSIVPRIAGRVLAFAGLGASVLAIDRTMIALPQVSIAAMGIFGVALSLFLGFRNNAAYDRWWEGRRLWGQMIADGRSLGRETAVFLQDSAARNAVMRAYPAFAHLHAGALRGQDRGARAAEWDSRAPDWCAARNPADAALRAMAAVIAGEAAAGRLSDMGQKALTERLAAVSLAQAGCERLAATPLPFVYSLLVLRTSYLYCLLLPFALIDTAGGFAPFVEAIVAYVFFGLSAVTDELEHPFRDAVNGLPLDAMCRIIDVSVAEALGEAPPPYLLPVDDVLS